MFTIFTVDVEGHVGDDPIEHLVYGRTRDNELCGIDMLMEVLDIYKMQGLFFVDIAEAWDYGKDRIEGVLRHIKERGHDVGVHIHPDHMADKKRLFLSEYSKEEQHEIISRCSELYENTLGEPPIAFRAGKYGANRETLDILAELGYKVDFSEFYGQKWCQIDPPVAKANVQELDNGLIEIPVTSYVSLITGSYIRHDKLDCGQSISEFKSVIKKLKKNDNDIAVLFAHSFSLIDWRRTPNAPRYNANFRKRLERQLEYVRSETDIKYLSLEDAIRVFGDYSFKDVRTESFIAMTGLMPFIWFAGRAKTVMKSRFDIKYRRLA